MPYSAVVVVIIIFCLLEIRIIASVLEHFFFLSCDARLILLFE